MNWENNVKMIKLVAKFISFTCVSHFFFPAFRKAIIPIPLISISSKYIDIFL